MRGRNIITERNERIELFDDEETHERVRVTVDDALRELTLPEMRAKDFPSGPSLPTPVGVAFEDEPTQPMK